MKPFITDALQGGRFVLPWQVEGLPADQVGKHFEGARVLTYGLPESHTLQAAWLFRLVLDSGWTVDFSSACTAVGDWQEIGSLNLEFAHERPNSDPIHWVTKEVANFRVKSVERLIYEDADVYTECGIVLTDFLHNEIVVAAGTAPGSISVAAPFAIGAFEPELAIDKLQRQPI